MRIGLRSAVAFSIASFFIEVGYFLQRSQVLPLPFSTMDSSLFTLQTSPRHYTLFSCFPQGIILGLPLKHLRKFLRELIFQHKPVDHAVIQVPFEIGSSLFRDQDQTDLRIDAANHLTQFDSVHGR